MRGKMYRNLGKLRKVVEEELTWCCLQARMKVHEAGIDTSQVMYSDVSGIEYLQRAFGLICGLAIAKYGYIGEPDVLDKDYPRRNLLWWLYQIMVKVVEEQSADVLETDKNEKVYRGGDEEATLEKLRMMKREYEGES